MVANLLCEIRWINNIDNELTNYDENCTLRNTKLIVRHNFLLRNTLFLHEENSCAINMELHYTQIDRSHSRISNASSESNCKYIF